MAGTKSKLGFFLIIITSIEKLIGNYPKDKKQSAVVPCLFYAQRKAGGWLPEKAILAVSELLDMPKIRVLEIATFYSMFNLQPSGDHFIQVCGTTPCWLRGSDVILKKFEEDLNIKVGGITKDELFSLHETECLGACVDAPVIKINNNYYENLKLENIKKIV